MLGGALWNALFEMLVVRGIKALLVGAAMPATGRGPAIAIRDVMGPVIHHAAWVASLWTAVVWLAAAATIHYASADPRLEPPARAPSGPAE